MEYECAQYGTQQHTQRHPQTGDCPTLSATLCTQSPQQRETKRLLQLILGILRPVNQTGPRQEKDKQER